MTNPTHPKRPRLVSDYYNSILLKMTPKPSALELTILSIMDGICKGNKKKGTCCLSLSELTKMVTYRSPNHSIHPDSVKAARRKLVDRGLLIQTGAWNRKKIYSTVIPRAEAEGFKGLQIPLEAATSPHLSHAAKLIFGRIYYLLTVNDGDRVYLEWTNKRLADDLNVGLGQIIQGLGELREQNFIYIHHGNSRVRKVGLNYDWNVLNNNYLPTFERESKISKGGKSITVQTGKGGKSITVKSVEITAEQPNKVINLEAYTSARKSISGVNKYLKDNKSTFPLEKYGTSGSGQPVQGESTFACQREVESLSDKTVANPRKEDRSMPLTLVPVPEEANRTFDYWNSRGEPLPRHRVGTRVHKDAIKAIRKALKIHKEKTIRNAIDLYRQSLTRTDLNLFRFKSAPVRVGLDEFFQFSGFTIGVIADRKIKGFDGGGISWFDICLKGAAEVEQRFAVVPVDKFPVVTKLLQKVIGSWDDHPKVTGPIAEKQLQIVSAKLVEFHQRIKPRMLTGGFLKFSTPEFLKEYFVPYLQEMLGKRGVEGFQLWWMIGDGFVDEFEQYLVRLHTIKKPVMVRHLKRRVGCDQNISFGSGSRAAYHHRYDNECELSAADFKNI
jgi:hypothetical protein